MSSWVYAEILDLSFSFLPSLFKKQSKGFLYFTAYAKILFPSPFSAHLGPIMTTGIDEADARERIGPRDRALLNDRRTVSRGTFSPIAYTINGTYTRNGNQYCPMAIMLHRDCRYTMQLSTTRWTCQERNEGDQWIFNCQSATDSRQNLEIMLGALYNWPALFPDANYNVPALLSRTH